MDIWDSRAVLLHVRAAIYACKQMELDVNFSRAQEAVTTEELNLDVTKEAYVQVRTSKKKRQREIKEKPYRPILNPKFSQKRNMKKPCRL